MSSEYAENRYFDLFSSLDDVETLLIENVLLRTDYDKLENENLKDENNRLKSELAKY